MSQGRKISLICPGYIGLALGTPLNALRPADAIALALAHEQDVDRGWRLVQRLLRDGGRLVPESKMKLDRASMPEGIELWRL
jgi:UDP-N-acetyl-D-glucosamine/UDP-N-acetyl-D-galactosamine dehydrogenase